MKVADRALLANMAPEYGATMGFFPVDEQTLAYLRETGRTAAEVDLVERYTKEQQLFRSTAGPAAAVTPKYTKVLRLDLATIEPNLAGPKRPQDRVRLADMKQSFRKALHGADEGSRLCGRARRSGENRPRRAGDGQIGHGVVVIASITSCTNTSNPSVMLAAGLLAQKAVQRGLRVKPHVKTSLAPGSRVVTDYLRQSGLDKPLEQLGFHTVGLRLHDLHRQ